MAYNPNRMPKGANNKAGFGQPGTAATRQQRNAGRGYNPNMPMGRQLARQAAGGGQPSGRTWSDPGRAYLPPPPTPAPQPSGIDYAALAAQPTYGEESNKQYFTFQDPVETIALKHQNWGAGSDPGHPGISWRTDQMGRLVGDIPGAYYATGQPVEGNYAYPSNLAHMGYAAGGVPGVADVGTPYQPMGPTPPPPMPPGMLISQMPGAPGAVPMPAAMPYQPPLAQPAPAQPSPEDLVISQVPETPAGTGYAMLAGMPHEDLLGMNKSMGISNISDLSQTQEQLSPFAMGPADQVTSIAYESDEPWGEEEDEEEESEKKLGVALGPIYSEEQQEKMDAEEEEEKAKFEAIKQEKEQEEKDEAIGEQVYEGVTGFTDTPGGDPDIIQDNIDSINAEEKSQMDNLTDMYMNAYQEQSGALNRQYAMMGMLGSSNHMVANNSIMVQMLDQMAKERTELGKFYDSEIFKINQFNAEQFEIDLEDNWTKYMGWKAAGQTDAEIAAAMGTTILNTMIAYTDKIGGDFLNMLQSLEKLSDADKKEWSSKVNKEEMAFWECVGGDASKIDSCGAVFTKAVAGFYEEFGGGDSVTYTSETGEEYSEEEVMTEFVTAIADSLKPTP